MAASQALGAVYPRQASLDKKALHCAVALRIVSLVSSSDACIKQI